jgi:hypothetical protein
MSTLKPHTECLECGRQMRGPRVPASEAPGTVRHVGRGRCITCRDRDRYREYRVVDREIQLCRWLPGDEYRVERAQLVTGSVVAIRAKEYVLRIDGVNHTYSRDDWFEVSL